MRGLGMISLVRPRQSINYKRWQRRKWAKRLVCLYPPVRWAIWQPSWHIVVGEMRSSWGIKLIHFYLKQEESQPWVEYIPASYPTRKMGHFYCRIFKQPSAQKMPTNQFHAWYAWKIRTI